MRMLPLFVLLCATSVIYAQFPGRGRIRPLRDRDPLPGDYASKISELPNLEAEKRLSRGAAPVSNAGIYEEDVLRTIFLRFPKEDWFHELEDFYSTDVAVPVDLIIDGQHYRSVGSSFGYRTVSLPHSG